MSLLRKLFSIALITVGVLPGIVSAQFHLAGRVKWLTLSFAFKQSSHLRQCFRALSLAAI